MSNYSPQIMGVARKLVVELLVRGAGDKVHSGVARHISLVLGLQLSSGSGFDEGPARGLLVCRVN